MDPEEKARQKAANVERYRGEVEGLLKLDASTLSFPECMQKHGELRGKIMEMQTLVIKGLFDLKVERELEASIVKKIHEVEERAHALQTGAGGLPGAADRQVPR